jgi:serine/threonine protein kinase
MLPPNTLLQNRYLIEKKLGQGGMGAVYQAVDKRFDTTVALKETLVTDENLRKAFEREARLLNKLRHASLPHVIDFFAEGDGQFLVMQFIPGDDLGALLERNGRPFATSQALTWADHLLAALEYLHAFDPPIVHRDIKPANVKLTPQGEVILLDFGLSKGSAADVSMTAGGASVAGYTPHFAPLEQIRGSGTNPRSDLYSLAATLYLLLTGQTPPDALERASASLGGRPDPIRPITQLNPSVSPAVAQVLHVALSQMPENRWVSATSMRNALKEAAQVPGSATVQQRPPQTVPVGGTIPVSQPPSGAPQGPTGYPPQGPTSYPPQGPTAYPAPQPQQQPMQPMMPLSSAPTLPAPGAPYQTAQGLFNVPPSNVWPAQQMPNMAAYTSTPSVQRKPRTIRWTLFVIWLVLGIFISLVAAAAIAVAAVGDDPPAQLTIILTGLIYFAGVIGLLIWCKI